MSSPLTINWGTLISSGVGALIGGSLTLVATLVAHHLDKNKAQDEEEKVIFGFLQGIHDEIETLWDIYNENVGSHIESLPAGQPFNAYWGVLQEYFTFYSGNAHLVGRIDDHDLRKQIVSTYAHARSLIDSYQMNNELVRKHEQAQHLYEATGEVAHAQQAKVALQILTVYADALKQSHSVVKSDVTGLLRSLRKKGVLADGNHF